MFVDLRYEIRPNTAVRNSYEPVVVSNVSGFVGFSFHVGTSCYSHQSSDSRDSIFLMKTRVAVRNSECYIAKNNVPSCCFNYIYIYMYIRIFIDLSSTKKNKIKG